MTTVNVSRLNEKLSSVSLSLDLLRVDRLSMLTIDFLGKQIINYYQVDPCGGEVILDKRQLHSIWKNIKNNNKIMFVSIGKNPDAPTTMIFIKLQRELYASFVTPF